MNIAILCKLFCAYELHNTLNSLLHITLHSLLVTLAHNGLVLYSLKEGEDASSSPDVGNGILCSQIK